MKISDIIKGKEITLSFEVFPPKTEDQYESVSKAVEELSFLSPGFMPVTCGAGGTSQNAVRIAKEIQQKDLTTALAYLRCLKKGVGVMTMGKT